MLGIHPDYQSMGIGKKLKEEQRKFAKEMGYDLITWTFDPLESRNAYLNVSKLYGICRYIFRKLLWRNGGRLEQRITIGSF